MFQAGSVEGHAIESFQFSWRNGWSEAWAWLQVRGGFYLFEQTRPRSYNFRCAIGPSDLAEDLAAAAIGKQLPRLSDNALVLVRRADLVRRLARLRKQRDELEFAVMLDEVRF